MSRREEAKAENRDRILAAAAKIIRQEGFERLTMRHLAESADVSLRTPYNLIGSKTQILLGLLDGAGLEVSTTGQGAGSPPLGELFGLLNKVETFFGSDPLFYRDIYGQLMASNEQEVRQGRVSQIAQMCLHLLGEAVGREELRRETDPDALGRFLANQLVAFLGMWGAGFFDHRTCIAQVRGTWAASLLPYANSKSRPMLEMMCGSVMKGGVLDA